MSSPIFANMWLRADGPLDAATAFAAFFSSRNRWNCRSCSAAFSLRPSFRWAVQLFTAVSVEDRGPPKFFVLRPIPPAPGGGDRRSGVGETLKIPADRLARNLPRHLRYEPKCWLNVPARSRVLCASIEEASEEFFTTRWILSPKVDDPGGTSHLDTRGRPKCRRRASTAPSPGWLGRKICPMSRWCMIVLSFPNPNEMLMLGRPRLGM